MKLSRHIYDLISRVTLLLAMVLLAVSCVDDASLCPENQPGFDPDNNVWLSLHFDGQGISGIGGATSRSGNLDDPDASGHPSDKALAAENYIDFEDLTLILFDKYGMSIKTLSGLDFIRTSTAADYSSYELLTQVNRSYFDYAGGAMSVLAVANSHGINRQDLSARDYNDVDFGTSIGDLTKQLRSYYYDGQTVSGRYDTPWTPDIEAGRHIPMAGYETGITLNSEALTAIDKATTPATAFKLPNITMQRSMAKFRVLDGLPYQTNLSAPAKIIKVDLRNGTERGAIVPDINQQGLAQWGVNGTTIVETATKPTTTGEWHSQKLTFPFASGATFSTDEYAGKTETYETFICYTPEMQIKGLPFEAQYQPYLEFLVDIGNETREYTVRLDKAMAQSEIVRNHIYQFHVTLNESSANLELQVVDWEDETINWEYTENPGLAKGGHILWDNLQSDNPSTATAVLKDDMSPAACHFTIATPLNATWRAVFIPLTGPQDAFVFIDETGQEVSDISGVIDGTQQNLKIKPKYATATENYSAKLQIIVSTPDGRTMNVNVLEDARYGNNKYYTIVQNKTL